MNGQISRMRNTAVMLGMCALWAWPAIGHSATEENSKRLENHFSSLGTVEYFLPTPLGGPEMGAAVIRDGGGFEMRVVELRNGQPVSRLTERMPEYTGKRPFTFLLTGKQFLSYPTRSWTDDKGRAHEIGDLKIYDMTGESPQVLFELDNVTDLAFQAKGALTASNLVWQPADHYLNVDGLFPVKYKYFIIRQDETGQYDIMHHLELLPDNGLVESARYNNRAVYYYQLDDLTNAIAAIGKANIITDRDQSVILSNTDLLKSELADLEFQASHNPSNIVDEARMYYWTGQYQSALRVLETRQRRMSDTDWAMSGLCMARLKRWPEADNITAELKRRGVPWLGDYLSDLMKVAEIQQLPRVLEIQMRAMEALDPQHPALAAAKARILEGAGKMDEAQRLLEGYLARRPNRDVEEARYELYGIYFNKADQLGMDRLLAELKQGQLTDLNSYVNLKDYHDFSVVMEELEADQTDFIKSPDKPLDDLTLK
ncbi:MAG: hypothetical protein H7A35_00005 [Planctomycetales bacterium]|nr:hypothetical protein [bacterium]UNM08449.1 MAG: hypothetical protein H7A35_00005 [Planctomycetales bacterium]